MKLKCECIMIPGPARLGRVTYAVHLELHSPLAGVVSPVLVRESVRAQRVRMYAYTQHPQSSDSTKKHSGDRDSLAEVYQRASTFERLNDEPEIRSSHSPPAAAALSLSRQGTAVALSVDT